MGPHDGNISSAKVPSSQMTSACAKFIFFKKKLTKILGLPTQKLLGPECGTWAGPAASKCLLRMPILRVQP